MTRFLAPLLAALVFAGPAGAAAGGCHAVAGTFVASSPQTCAGIFCTVGRLSGDLEGIYSFVGYAFAPDGGILGHSTITLDNGAVITSDDKSLLFGLPLPGTHGAGGLVAPGTITQTGTAVVGPSWRQCPSRAEADA